MGCGVAVAQISREQTVDGINVTDVKLAASLADVVGRVVKLSGGAGGSWQGCALSTMRRPPVSIFIVQVSASATITIAGLWRPRRRNRLRPSTRKPVFS